MYKYSAEHINIYIKPRNDLEEIYAPCGQKHKTKSSNQIDKQ